MTQKQFKKIADLTPDNINANKGTERGTYILEKSVRDYGLGRSIVVDRNGKIIAGNKTHATAGAIGIEDIETIHTSGDKLVVVVRDDLDLDTDAKARELALVDNRSSEVGLDWDWDNIEQIQKDFDVELSPFWRDDELPEHLRQELEGGDDDTGGAGSDLGSEDFNSRVSPGELWRLGRHYLFCGNSTDLDQIKFIAKETSTVLDAVNMVWADPPYGINVVDKTGKLSSGKGKSKAKPGQYVQIEGDDSTNVAEDSVNLFLAQCPKALQVWWGANYYTHALPASSGWIVWDKENTGDRGDGELAWTNHTGAVRIFKHQWNGMIRESERGQKRIHPTQKPVALFTWFAEKYGKDDDIIFDPFSGSGIAIIGAQQMEGGRSVIAIEKAKEYCELTIQRFENEFGLDAERIATYSSPDTSSK